MEYHHSYYFGLKKRVVSILHHVVLFAMLHSTFVAPAQGMIDAYIHNRKPLKYSGSSYTSVSPNNGTDQTPIQSQLTSLKYKETAHPSRTNSYNTVTSYSVSADINEGIIGVSKDKPLDSPSDNLFKVNLTQLPTGNDKVYLTYEVFGVADHHSVARSINERLSVGGHLVKKQLGWSQQKEEINPSWLHQGQNTVLFTIPNGADYQYKIKNLSISVERNNKPNSLLALGGTLLSFSKDNTVYVKGFLRGNYPEAKIEAGGAVLQVSNNEFEGYVSLTDEIKKHGFLMIKATNNGQLLGQEIIYVDTRIEADSFFPIETKGESVSKLFKSGTTSRLDIAGATIIANDSALVKDYAVSISRLRNIDVAPMESGMINVTKGGMGYRFLPDGAKFEKPVSLSIAYDLKLIPTGYTEKDVKTYYFDTNNKRWVAVHKDSTDVKNNTILSRTTHFTDYINGIIQAPDSPETSAFTPTMMSDIKAADPAAEMTLISPPSASQKGDANVSYPIKLPSGRRGMQPQLALQYSNEGGNSWLGLGWNLSVPAMTIDTKWGVPLFDAESETEIYALNGEQLMYPDGYFPNRHQDGAGGTLTTVWQNRNGSETKVFYPRKQGSFAKIERLGNTPQTYYWKVTNTDGTIYWYGGKTSADVQAGKAVLKDSDQRIVHWSLFMVEDVYGNNMTYMYETFTNYTTSSNLYQGQQLYLTKINYTGYGNDLGNYDVDFLRKTTRSDVNINARLGIKQVDFHLLEQIKVSYKTEIIKSYFLNYTTGRFNKSLLASVSERDNTGNEFYKHTFDYYDDIKQADGSDVYFSAEVEETLCIEQPEALTDKDNDGVMDSVDRCIYIPGSALNQGCPENDYSIIFDSLKNPPTEPDCTSLTNIDFLIQGNMPSFDSSSSPLGSSKTKGSGWGAYFGIGLGCKPFTKNTTFGPQYNESSDKSESFSAFIDLDGDSLDDIVYKAVSGSIYYQKHNIENIYENGNLKIKHTYGPAQGIFGISNFYKANSQSTSWNFQVTFGFSRLGGFAGIDKSETRGETNVYFTDANGDGLPDIVKNGTVFFNRIVNGKPEFIPDSMGSPNLVITAEPRTVEVPAEYSETELDIPNYDVVKVWEAPYTGALKITNDIVLTDPSQEVTVTIETRIKNLSGDDGCLLYAKVLNSGSPEIHEERTTPLFPNNCGHDKVPGGIGVNQGTLVFFRVHASGTGVNPKVDWDPKIEYINNPAMPDQNGLSTTEYRYSQDFLLAQKNIPVVFPGNGTATITWDDITVNAPSDNVTFEIYKSIITTPTNGDLENSNSNDQLIYRRSCAADVNTLVSPGINEINEVLNNIVIASNGTPGANNTSTVFYFKIKADSNVNWKQIEWKPRVNCITQESVIGEDAVPEGTITTNQTFYGIPDVTVYKVYNREFSGYAFLNSYVDTNTSTWPFGASQSLFMLPYLNGLFSSTDNGTIKFVVKRNGSLIGKRTVYVTNGNISFDNSAPINIGTQADDHLEIGFYVDDTATMDASSSLLSKLYNMHTTGSPSSYSFSVVKVVAGNWATGSPMFLTEKDVNLFHIPLQTLGSMHHQWGQFAYNPSGVEIATVTPFGNLINANVLTLIQDTAQLQQAVGQLENWGENITEQNLEDFEAQYGGLSSDAPFVAMHPSRLVKDGVLEEKWIGICPENYVSALSYRAARLNAVGEDYIDPDDYTVQEVIQTGAYGISKYTKGKSRNISIGVNPGTDGLTPNFSAGASASKSLDATSNSLTDYVDLNGDRYPDIASTDLVQYTKGTGGLRVSVSSNSRIDGNGGSQIAKYTNSSWGFSASGSYQRGEKANSSTNGQGNAISRFFAARPNSSAAISGNFQKANSATTRMWADVNGDGLSDILEKSPDNINVRLNLGNNVYQEMQVNASTWGLTEMFNSKSYSYGGGIGFNKWNGSFEFGVSAGSSKNGVENTLVDMNADGIADVVHSDSNGISVRINKGNGFGPSALWSNYTMTRESESNTSSFNGGATYAYPIPIPFLGICFKIAAIGLNGQTFSSTTRTKKSISDYNGDGYPDLIKEDHKKLKIQYSNIRRTNMLKSVANPLGGKFTVDYDVIMPTYNNPNAKWVLKKVVVEDGYDLVNDGVDTYSKNFEYENGYYDRREREFYGYEKVKTIDYIPGQPGVVYRTAVSVFHNQSYYLNGLNISSYVMKGNNESQLFSKSLNSYAVKKLTNTGLIDLGAATAPLSFDTGGSEGRRAAAVQLESTENYIYELGTTPLISRVEYTYDDARGRISKYDYKGNIAVAEDNYTANISYYSSASLESNNIYTVPKTITIKNHSGTEARYREVAGMDGNTGAITKIKSKITGTTFAETNMAYDQYGNLSQVTLPPNETGQQFSYTYLYDADNHKLPVTIQDSFGYVSSTDYDYRFDKPIKTTDITGNQMNYAYDNFSRLLKVQSPKELANSIPYTISFKYYPKYSDLSTIYDCTDEEDFIPVAVTSHYDAQHPDNDIQTYTFIDGIGRPVQVKKDIEFNYGTAASPNLKESVSVSGKVTYDSYGRAVKQYHPYFESKKCNINLVVNEYDSPNVATTQYDEIDRPVQSIDPEGNASVVQYSLGSDYFTHPALKTSTSVE